MPSKSFTINLDQPRKLTITRRHFSYWRNVYLDDKPLGSFKSRHALKEGRIVPLPDGSKLSIRQKRGFFRSRLEILHKNKPLPGSDTDPYKIINDSGTIMILVAVATVMFSLIEFTSVNVGFFLSLFIAALFLFMGQLARGFEPPRWPLPFSTGLLIADTIIYFIGIKQGFIESDYLFTFIIVRIFLIAGLIQGTLAFYEIYTHLEKRSLYVYDIGWIFGALIANFAVMVVLLGGAFWKPSFQWNMLPNYHLGTLKFVNSNAVVYTDRENQLEIRLNIQTDEIEFPNPIVFEIEIVDGDDNIIETGLVKFESEKEFTYGDYFTTYTFNPPMSNGNGITQLTAYVRSMPEHGGRFQFDSHYPYSKSNLALLYSATVCNTSPKDFEELSRLIQDANRNYQPDVINLSAGCHYYIPEPLTVKSDNHQTVTINGNGAIFDAGNVATSVIVVEEDALLNINQLTIMNTAYTEGSTYSAIYNSGTLDIGNVTLQDNAASALVNSGKATILDSQFIGNGTGINNQNYGVLSVSGSFFQGNSTGVYNVTGYSGVFQITESTISRNESGISVYSGRIIASEISLLENERPLSLGNNVENVLDSELTNSDIRNNQQGINLSGRIRIRDSVILENQQFGVSVNPEGVVFLERVVIASNIGYGISLSPYTHIINSTITQNTEGGVQVNTGSSLSDTALIMNTTISDNGEDEYLRSTNLMLMHPLTLVNVIVASSTNNLIPNCFINPYTQSITTIGENYSTDESCSGFTQVTAEELNLGELGDYGGSIQTIPLLPGSIAIDAVPEGECGVETDQRGMPRPAGSACDVGAFEVQPED